ncbi:MAG: SDR family NAD(P)-dependent oxidoreductase [Acholeplasmatales bacterium]|nr:SDR family NAD(P)-dependent oxidoreductase [Acholeplasmatales bacterium]
MEKLAITGSTGTLGNEVVKKIVNDYHLILINRNIDKSNKQKDELLKINPNAKIDILTCNMEDFNNVKELTDKLIDLKIDYFIINAGILVKEKHTTNFGYDNVFTTNFLAPYYIVNRLKENNLPKVKVIALGSVAQKWGKLDKDNIDYSNYKSKNKRYGNSKRFLISSLMELYKDDMDKLTICHPGITLSNMTKNYNKFIKFFTIIFLSIFFQGKKKASRSIVKAITTNTNYLEWVGPHIWGIYGKPKVCKIKKLKKDEIIEISSISRGLYDSLKAL